MIVSLSSIFLYVLLPILVMILLGVLVNWKRTLNIDSLNQLTIYLIVPAFLFEQVYDSSLSWGDITEITYGVFLPTTILGAILWWIYHRRGYPGSTTSALLLGGLVFNAGNFGLPLTQLFYEQHPDIFPGMNGEGLSVQAMMIMLSNISIWLIGYGVIAFGKGQGFGGMLGFFRLPMIYTVLAAFAVRETQTNIPVYLLKVIEFLSHATVPIMLLTLGAQLAKNAQWPQWRLIGPAMVVKLLLLPALTGAIAWLFGLWPWPGAQLVIAAAAPTAVNTLIISLELDGDNRTAADCVFWTTIGSAVSVTAVLLLVVLLGGV
ncbi:MAG: AEC family transporter [Pirellulales bacterium]|nr:AEC family transporter [Pirellulales bacterium]